MQLPFYSGSFRSTKDFTGVHTLALCLAGDFFSLFIQNPLQYYLGCKSLMMIGSAFMLLQAININL